MTGQTERLVDNLAWAGAAPRLSVSSRMRSVNLSACTISSMDSARHFLASAL